MALGQYPTGTATPAVTPASGDGGGVTATAGNNFYTGTVFNTPKTSPWFVSYRAKITGAFSTGAGQIGIRDTGGSVNDYVLCGFGNAQSTTNFFLTVSHGGTTTSQTSSVALDNNTHDHSLYYDGSTTLNYYVDGVLASTLTNLANFPQTNQAIDIIPGAPNTVITYELYWAFTPP
jgi:hypothetical protein